MFVQQFVGGDARVGRFAGHEFIHAATETIHVRPHVQSFTTDLFGAHVAAGPLDLRPASLFLESPFFGLWASEVDQPGMTLAVDEEVVGLDVAMDPALGVELRQASCCLFDDPRYHPADGLAVVLDQGLEVRGRE